MSGVRTNDELWLWIILFSTGISVFVNILGIYVGTTLIPTALLYIPVILVGYRYPKQAILFSVGLGMGFLALVYGLAGSDGLSIAAGTAHFYCLVLVGILISILSSDLKANETKFRGLFERSEAGMFLIRCDALRLTIEEANERGAQIFGFQPNEIKNLSLIDLWPDEAERSPFLTKIGIGESIREYRATMERKDGSTIPVLISTGVLKDRRIVFTVSDISLLCAKEQELAQNEARTTAILSALPDLVFTIDRSGHILGCHAQETSNFYLPPGVILGRHYAEFLPGDLAKRMTRILDSLFENLEPQEIQYTLPVRGQERIFEARVVPSGTDQAVAVVRDVTDSVRAHDALAVSEARYRAIVEDQTELIVRYLPDGTINFGNGAFSSLMGRKAEELAGLSLYSIIPNEERMQVNAIISNLTPEMPSARIDHRIHSSTGDTRWTRWTYRARFSSVGALGEFQAVGRDITEQKMREEIERRSLRQIEQNIEQFAIIGDHIRNPLTVIVGLADLQGGEFKDRIIEQAKVIDEFITRMDMGWVESEKVRGFIRKYGGFGRN